MYIFWICMIACPIQGKHWTIGPINLVFDIVLIIQSLNSFSFTPALPDGTRKLK